MPVPFHNPYVDRPPTYARVCFSLLSLKFSGPLKTRWIAVNEDAKRVFTHATCARAAKHLIIVHTS